MIINEFKRLLSQSQTKALLLFIIIGFLFSSLYIPSSNEYEEVYEQYGQDIESFYAASNTGSLNFNEATIYFYDQADYISGYREGLNDKISEVEGKLESDLFNSSSDQKKLNKEKTFYRSLDQENIGMESIYKVDKVLEDRIFYYLMPLISCILILLIFSEDIEKETLTLFMTTKKSLAKLFWVKSFVYLTFMTSICILLAFVMFFRTGFSTIPVHSIPEFRDVMGNYSVFIFIVKEALNIFINSVLSAYSLLILFIIFKNQALAFVGLTSLYFIEAILYLFIPVNSALAYLKYFNIFYLTFIDRLNFMVINTSTRIFSISILLIVFITMYLLYKKHNGWKLLINRGMPLRTTSLTLQSIYQLFINYRGIIMIIIILLFSFYNINGFKVSSKPEEKFYQSFKSSYLGPINLSLEEKILKDEELIRKAYEKSLALKDYIELKPDQANKIYSENDEVFTMARNYENIVRLISEVEEAKSIGVNHLVDTRGTDLLFMKNQNLFKIQNILILIIPILIFGFYQAINSFNKESLALVYPSRASIKPYLKSQRIALLLLSFTSVFILMGLHYFKIVRELTINLTDSLKELMVVNINMPIWLGLVLLYLFISMIISGIGILAQSIVRYSLLRKNIKNNKKAV